MTTPASVSGARQELLLAEYRAPKNRRAMPFATARAAHKNPLCGDAIEVMVRDVSGRIADVSFAGHGCSIAVASASLLTQAVRGRTIREALALASDVERMLDRATPGQVDLPDILDALRGVAPFPGRHECALMAWRALHAALDARRSLEYGVLNSE